MKRLTSDVRCNGVDIHCSLITLASGRRRLIVIQTVGWSTFAYSTTNWL